MNSRADIATAKRLVVKVGSSSLTNPSGDLAIERLDELVRALAQRATRTEIVLVSSGAIAAGLAPLGLTSRPKDLASQQAAASVGQSRLMAHYSNAFAQQRRTVGQVLLTAEDLTRRSHYNNAQRTLERLLELSVIPIVNENDTVATAEIRFGDNDRLAALVAIAVKADALVLLSDVAGLFDGPPSSTAKLIDEVADFASLQAVKLGGSGSLVGSGGMLTKIEAAGIAVNAGIPVLLAAAKNVSVALATALTGTVFNAETSSKPARELWLQHASAVQGRLQLDAGASQAVLENGSSLLAAGVVGIEGDFSAGDAVDLLGPSGVAIARGLVGFDAVEVARMLGKSTTQIAHELGDDYAHELVHRDDLVLLPPTWERA